MQKQVQVIEIIVGKIQLTDHQEWFIEDIPTKTRRYFCFLKELLESIEPELIRINKKNFSEQEK